MSDYPTEADLAEIKKYDIFSKPLITMNPKTRKELVDFIGSIWWMPDFGFEEHENGLNLSTGGWSGNEEIIEALRSTLFWMLYWSEHHRGGHYKFKWEDKKEAGE